MWVSSWPSEQFKFCDPKVSYKDANISLGGFPPFPHLPKEVQGIIGLSLLEVSNFGGTSSSSTTYFPSSFFLWAREIFLCLGEKSFLSTLAPFFRLFFFFGRTTFPYDKNSYAFDVFRVQFLTYHFLPHLGKLLDFSLLGLNLLLFLKLVHSSGLQFVNNAQCCHIFHLTFCFSKSIKILF